MAIPQVLLLELHVLGQEAVFTVPNGTSVGTIQCEPIWGDFDIAELEVIRGNDSANMVPAEAPTSLTTTTRVTPTLDTTCEFIGLRVKVAGGPSVAKVFFWPTAP